ncbi:hypothetical protein CRUP_005527 [Coryphaenoides rupestris]|nr:hypothetical protein CRUP_005527 [Coryphaenoides rupestris]
MDIELLLYRLQRRWWPLSPPGCHRSSMFNLMSNCCSWVSKMQEPIRKVALLVVGLDKAGKTSSIRGMLKAESGELLGEPAGCRGGTGVSGAWRALYGDVHGIIFVVDSSDRHRIKEVKEVLSDMLKHPRVAGKPILV